jgi:molecular chaperone DnaK
MYILPFFRYFAIIFTQGDIMTKMVDANTTIPTKKSNIFSTSSDSQKSVEIVVLQGERPMGKDNKQLGVFSLEVDPAPRGIPQIEITYDIDSNGVLNVTAEDKATGKKNNITISGSTKLSDEEIERMKKEAEANSEADKIAVEKINKLNEADSMIFNTEKQIKEFDEKLTDQEKSTLNEKLTNLKEAYSTKDLDKVNPALEDLNTSWMEISTRIYSEQQTQNQDVSQETNESDKVQDVDFEEVK